MGTLSQVRMVVNPVGVDFTFQGGLVMAKVKVEDSGRLRGGPRGVVTAFSAASRTRLLKLFASLDLEGHFGVFITLTYMSEFPSPAVAKAHRRAFEARMLRFAPNASWVWRMEFQKRGAPHFHFIVFGLPFLDKKKVQSWWAEIIGVPGQEPFTRIEALRSRRQVVSYVSKYVAKVADDGGFNLLAYLHGGLFVHPVTGEISGTVGRWWGVGNSQNLPFAIPTLVSIGCDLLPAFYAFRRGARKHFRGCSRRSAQGFFLFTSDARQWLDYWFAVVCRAA